MPTMTAPNPSQTVDSASLNFEPSSGEKRDFARRLREQTLACRLHHRKLGVRKSLSADQIRRAAGEFDADSDLLTAAKRILDTTDPSYSAVVRVRGRATHYWKAVTTPFPEPGVRLIRKSSIEEFNRQMTQFASELNQAAQSLQIVYADLRDRARIKLGDLFNPSDYPARVDGEFSLDWDFPSIEPPAFLKDLHPELYEQERQRIAGRFAEAARLTEEAFAAEFQKLISHLAERLKGDLDGKPKVFRDSAVENLTDFFNQFQALSLGGGSLGKLVEQAREIVKGKTPDDLRSDRDASARVADELGRVASEMDQMMINKPKRAIELED